MPALHRKMSKVGAVHRAVDAPDRIHRLDWRIRPSAKRDPRLCHRPPDVGPVRAFHPDTRIDDRIIRSRKRRLNIRTKSRIFDSCKQILADKLAVDDAVAV